MVTIGCEPTARGLKECFVGYNPFAPNGAMT